MEEKVELSKEFIGNKSRNKPGFVVNRDNSQNLQHHLWERESGGYSNRRNRQRHPTPPWHLSLEREFHKSITPNLTVQNVDKPLGYMRKFTPDGRLLLSFSHDQRSLEVYTYRGVGRVAALLQQEQNECITAADNTQESLTIRQQIYEQLFKYRWSVRLTQDMHNAGGAARCHLNREFSIFMENGRYVLLAAVATSNDVQPYEHILQNPDLCDDCDLYAYTFFLVDLSQDQGNDCVSDVLSYRQDCIMLSHNHGVSAHGRTVAILSKYRQCIDLLELVHGKLVRLQTIGPLGGSYTDVSLSLTLAEQSTYMSLTGDLPLSHFKQRILAHLYREIWTLESAELRRTRLREFYKTFKTYERMLMSKMQLIDGDHVFIRYEERPSQSGLEIFGEEKAEFKLYVFYCISSEKILKVYPKNSIELLYMLRNFCDHFRNVRSLQTQRPSSSPSNNAFFRAAFNSAITSIPGGQAEAALRFNPTLPISTQSFSTTQYLDYSLFNYDDRLISALERPKISSLEPIRFSDRITNITKFRLFLEVSKSGGATTGNNVSAANRELVAFIFHPYEPFIISIQKLSTRYVMNFHIYNEATEVKQFNF